jgi:hypothetical protein
LFQVCRSYRCPTLGRCLYSIARIAKQFTEWLRRKPARNPQTTMSPVADAVDFCPAEEGNTSSSTSTPGAEQRGGGMMRASHRPSITRATSFRRPKGRTPTRLSASWFGFAFFLARLAFFGLGLVLHFVFVGQKVHQGAGIGSQSAFSFAGRVSANTKFLQDRLLLTNDTPCDGDAIGK